MAIVEHNMISVTSYKICVVLYRLPGKAKHTRQEIDQAFYYSGISYKRNISKKVCL